MKLFRRTSEQPGRTIRFPAREPLPADPQLPSDRPVVDVEAVELAERLLKERDEARSSLASLHDRYDQAQEELLQAGLLAQRLQLEADIWRNHTCGKAADAELRAWSKRVEDLQRENERLSTELLAERGHDTSPDHRSPTGVGPFVRGSR